MILDIGGQKVRLDYLKRFPKGDRIGDWNYLKQRIRIKKGLEPYPRLNTEIHECLHAMISINGLQEDIGEAEERIVTLLATQLADFLIENPQIVKEWLTHADALNPS